MAALYVHATACVVIGSVHLLFIRGGLSEKAAVQVSTLLITPICPHTCDHIWRNILRRKGSALTAGFPVGGEPDFGIRCAHSLLSQTMR